MISDWERTTSSSSKSCRTSPPVVTVTGRSVVRKPTADATRIHVPGSTRSIV